MQRHLPRLYALLLILLLVPLPLLAAEDMNNLIEIGVGNVSIDDDNERVNEYSTVAPDEETVLTGKVEVSGNENGVVYDIDGFISGGDNINGSVSVDVNRRVRFKSDYQTFQHQLSNDQMKYLDAAVPSGANAKTTLNGLVASDPANYSFTAITDGVGTTIGGLWEVPDLSWFDANNVPGFIGEGTSGQLYVFSPASPYYKVTQGTNLPLDTISWQQLGRASLYGENFVPDENFFIDHQEFKNEFDIAVGGGITLHLGNRIETRKGYEQSIGMSKCTSCHITGQSREVDEKTTDLNIGFTGKFGLLTVDYNYQDREFRENADDPTRTYDPALAPNPNTLYTTGNSTFDNRLLYDYENGEIPYDTTPDSDKTSHVLKARADMAGNTSVIGSYVHTEVESRKKDAPSYFDVENNLMKTKYDSYAVKAVTKFGDKTKVAARIQIEKLESNENSILYTPMNTTSATSLGGAPNTTTNERESVEDRDVLTLGLDGVYRMARYTTVRLGYEYEAVDRKNDHYDETTTHTVKAKANTRFGREISARAGYTYQNIDSPLHNTDAAEYVDPNTGLPYYDKDQQTTGTIDGDWDPGFMIGTGPSYGTDYYDLRETDLSNLPESVHEGKVSATWSPSPLFSATGTFRMKMEENELDRSTWEQDSMNSGLSFWYAPKEQLNFTFAYNWLGQKAESKFCQGWYDG